MPLCTPRASSTPSLAGALTAARCSRFPKFRREHTARAASGSAHREVSLRSCSVAGVASMRYFQRHLARRAPTELIPGNRIARNELAPLNRSAPLPASRCCGVLRTAAARPACSRRNRDPACARGVVALPDRRRLRKRPASRRWKIYRGSTRRAMSPSDHNVRDRWPDLPGLPADMTDERAVPCRRATPRPPVPRQAA